MSGSLSSARTVTMLGHEEAQCRRKVGTRTEWRKVQKPSQEEGYLVQAGTLQVEQQAEPSNAMGCQAVQEVATGFTPVTSRVSPGQPVQSTSLHTPTILNQFQALESLEQEFLLIETRRGKGSSNG